MFIEFSGADGSGKTTALRYFCDRLQDAGKRVLRTREVGSPHVPACVKLREVILDPEAKMDGRAMELVFAAMRVEQQRFYDRVRDQYDFIVSDRGWLDHLAYNDHNVSEDFTRRFYLDVIARETYMPDRVYLFKVSPAEALRRRTKRAGFVDAIEAKGEEFQKLVAGSFIKYAQQLACVRHVDADRPVEEVQSYFDGEARCLCERGPFLDEGVDVDESDFNEIVYDTSGGTR